MSAIALMYHDVVEGGAFDASGFAGADAALYKLAREEFEAHLSAIGAGGAPSPVTVAALAPGRGRPLLITFDDGGVSAYTHAAEALERRGWRGHFFVTTGRIGTAGFLSREQIAELDRRGHVIGSHSTTHPLRMARCGYEEVLGEWRTSLEVLSEILGRQVTVASVPGGHYSRRVAEAANEAGIRHLFTSEPRAGLQRVGDCLVIGRYTVQRWTPASVAAALAAGRLGPRLRQAVYWNAKKATKAVAGEFYLRARTALIGRGEGAESKMSLTSVNDTTSAARAAGPPRGAGAEDFARELRGRDIICFAQDWTGDPLSKTHLMRVLARDNRVLWVNSIGLRAPSASAADLRRSLSKLKAVTTPLREVEPNIFVLNPLSVPAYGLPFMRAFNQLALRLQVRRAMRRLGFRRAVNYVFLPPAALVAGRLGEELVVYHCVDEYAAFSDIQAGPILEMEELLLRRADIVFASAELLVRSKIKHNPRTHLVRHGVDFTHFSRALDPATVVPDEVARLPRPVIGFFGLVADWVDVDLMAEVARHFAGGSLVILGKVTTDVSVLEGLPNVHLLGRKPYEELPAYCKGFDVALMPFRLNELTLNANPLKVREYLAAGLPVVSTPIPEVEVLGQCRIADGPAATIREVEAALADPGPARARSEAIRGESWEARLDEIRRHLAALESSKR